MAGIMMTGVYNHYLTTYASKETSQSDTHKKDDLKNVYKSIVKLNKSAPLVLLGQNDHAEASAIDLKEHARALKHTLSSLNEIRSEGKHSLKSAFSSSEDVAVANYIGDDDEAPSFSLRVDSLASNQVNTGNFLPEGGRALKEGNYAFNVRMGENNYEFQYAVSAEDTNIDVQERLGRLFNKASIGLYAEILTNENNENALVIGSRTTGLPTGKEHQFYISEESDSALKGTVSMLGLDNVTQKASDAKFLINGAEKISTSNRFTLGNFYELTLNRVSGPEEEVIIGLKNEKDSMVDHMHKLVDGYNKFLDSIGDITSESFRSSKIYHETVRVAKDSLGGANEAETALKITDDGHIEINEDALEKLAASPAEELDGHMGPVRNFSKALYEKADAIALNPMQYVSRPVVAYKDPERRDFTTPYITSEYSGMMFNNYC